MSIRSRLRSPLLLLLTVLSMLATAALAAQETTSVDYPLRDFTRISLKGGSHLQVVQGGDFAVTASGPADVMPQVFAELHGDTLELRVESSKRSFFGAITVSSDPRVRFQVTLPKVSGILVTGSGKAEAEALESESLELKVTGSGELRIGKVVAESLDTAVTGSGDLKVGSTMAVQGRASVTGSGDLRLDNYAGQALKADIRGSGDIIVGGRVAQLEVNVMGSGDFHGRNLLADSANGGIMGSGDIVLRRPASDSFRVRGSGDVTLVE